MNGVDQQMDIDVKHADVKVPDLVKTVKVPFQREKKKSFFLQDPYVEPLPTTPRWSKRGRPKSRLYTSKIDAVTGPDGNEIPL